MQTLPLLRAAMSIKKATNEALALAAGVSPRTVGHARRGGAIRTCLAEYICQALHSREFSRDNRGRRAVCQSTTPKTPQQ